MVATPLPEPSGPCRSTSSDANLAQRGRSSAIGRSSCRPSDLLAKQIGSLIPSRLVTSSRAAGLRTATLERRTSQSNGALHGGHCYAHASSRGSGWSAPEHVDRFFADPKEPLTRRGDSEVGATFWRKCRAVSQYDAQRGHHPWGLTQMPRIPRQCAYAW